MPNVYQHQLHAHRPHRPHYKRWAIAALLITIGVIVGLRLLKPDTKISKSGAVTKAVGAAPATKLWDEGVFTIRLPIAWQFVGAQHDVNNIYHFRSPISNDTGNRLLDVYQDSNPVNFAINRMVPVQANEDSLIVDSGQISDNCTIYTIGATTNRTTVGALAKWQNVTFLCDLANTSRNVVGTGSPDGLNTVVLTGEATGKHHFFFTYTENNDKPDYSIFTNALTSFHLK